MAAAPIGGATKYLVVQLDEDFRLLHPDAPANNKPGSPLTRNRS
jgi:hypothetical protein